MQQQPAPAGICTYRSPLYGQGLDVSPYVLVARPCADQVADQDGRLCTLAVVGRFTRAYNASMITQPLLTSTSPNDYYIWSLEPPATANGQQQQPLPGSSFSVATNGSQLLGLLQVRSPDFGTHAWVVSAASCPHVAHARWLAGTYIDM